MTTKMYRKSLARTVLAAPILLAGLLPAVAAHAEGRLHGLTTHDLLSGRLGHGSTVEAVPIISDAVSDAIDTGLAEADVVGAMVAQDGVNESQDVAQSSAVVGDTFSPLTEEEIRQRLLIEPEVVESPRARPAPASSFLTPTAYGADWGDAYVGLSGAISNNNAARSVDGSASAGFGLGSATDLVGLEVNATLISLQGFADDGTIGFKLHRVFPSANNLAIAFGWENPIKWGAASTQPESYYGVVSKRFDLQRGQPNPVPLTVSLGVGTGAYRSAGAIAANSNDPNFFGSIGLRVQPELSLISSWTGSGLGFAVSAAPFRDPFVFTIGVSDVTSNTVDGTRLTASVGYGYSF